MPDEQVEITLSRSVNGEPRLLGLIINGVCVKGDLPVRLTLFYDGLTREVPHAKDGQEETKASFQTPSFCPRSPTCQGPEVVLGMSPDLLVGGAG